MLGVIIVVIIIQKGSKKRKRNLTGAKSKQRNGENYLNRKQMEDFVDKNRSNARAYYIRQCSRVKSKARIAYKIEVSCIEPRIYIAKLYNRNKDSKAKKSIDYSKKCYNKNPAPKRSKALEYSQKLYSQNPLTKKIMSKKRYRQNAGSHKQKSLN